jgi:hypothetical protein
LRKGETTHQEERKRKTSISGSLRSQDNAGDTFSVFEQAGMRAEYENPEGRKRDLLAANGSAIASEESIADHQLLRVGFPQGHAKIAVQDPFWRQVTGSFSATGQGLRRSSKTGKTWNLLPAKTGNRRDSLRTSKESGSKAGKKIDTRHGESRAVHLDD